LRGRVNHSFDIHSFNSFLCLLRGSVFVSRRGSVDILILFHSHRHYLIPPHLLFHLFSAQYIIFSASSPCPSLITTLCDDFDKVVGEAQSAAPILPLSPPQPTFVEDTSHADLQQIAWWILLKRYTRKKFTTHGRIFELRAPDPSPPSYMQ
jgi:hypothetical protein